MLTRLTVSPLKRPRRSSTSPRAVVFALTVLLALAGVASAAHAQGRPGAKKAGLTNSDLRLGFSDKDLADHGDLSDQVTLRAKLDDGSTIYLRFLATNVATADGDAELKANVTRPGQKRLTGKVRRKDGTWSTSSDRLSAQVGHSRFDVRVGAASFRFRHKAFDLDLELRTSFKPIRPKGGRVQDDDDEFYVTTILAPRARLTGTLTVHGAGGGAQETDLSGVAYLEHRLGTIEPYNLAESWVNVRTMDKQHTLVSSSFRRPKDDGGGLHGWLIYATDRGVQLTVPEVKLLERDHTTDSKTDYRVPRTLTYSRPGGSRIGTVIVRRLLKRRDDLASLSGVARFVVERFMKPWTFEHEATFRFAPPGGVAASGETEYIYQRIN